MAIYIKPAYGKVYEDAISVLQDWKAGIDFHSDEGYLSIRDRINPLDSVIFFHNGVHVYIRHGIL